MIAYRLFRATDNPPMLRPMSLYQRYPDAWASSVAEAHGSPHDSWSIGLHAWTSLAPALRQKAQLTGLLSSMMMRTATDNVYRPIPAVVLASQLLVWGDIVEHEDGVIRAQFAKIIDLRFSRCMDKCRECQENERVAIKVARQYRVNLVELPPVEHQAEFDTKYGIV